MVVVLFILIVCDGFVFDVVLVSLFEKGVDFSCFDLIIGYSIVLLELMK